MDIKLSRFQKIANKLRNIAYRYIPLIQIIKKTTLSGGPDSSKIPKYFSGLSTTNYTTKINDFSEENKSQKMPSDWVSYIVAPILFDCTSLPASYGNWFHTYVGIKQNPVTQQLSLYGSKVTSSTYIQAPFYKGLFSFDVTITSNVSSKISSVEYHSWGDDNGFWQEYVDTETVWGLECLKDGTVVTKLQGGFGGFTTSKLTINIEYPNISQILIRFYTNNPSTASYNFYISNISYIYTLGTTKTPTTPSVWWLTTGEYLAKPYQVLPFEEGLAASLTTKNDSYQRTPVISHTQKDSYVDIDMPEKKWDGTEGWFAGQAEKFTIKDEDIKKLKTDTIKLFHLTKSLDTESKLNEQEIQRDLDIEIEKGNVISEDILLNLERISDKIIEVLDNYDSYYNDDTNLCNIQCQIACQTGCLVACQSCNNGQCHDQKCGMH
jgi:hypothetical protein